MASTALSTAVDRSSHRLTLPHPPALLFHLDNRESSIENRQRENKWANINHSNLRQIALMIMSHKILCTKSPRRERERKWTSSVERFSINWMFESFVNFSLHRTRVSRRRFHRSHSSVREIFIRRRTAAATVVRGGRRRWRQEEKWAMSHSLLVNRKDKQPFTHETFSCSPLSPPYHSALARLLCVRCVDCDSSSLIERMKSIYFESISSLWHSRANN